LTTPSYFGGLPAGYDLINAATLPAVAALADGPKVGGPNQGTYFHAFGEDATHSFFNRPAKALSQNTDHLDDLLHRDLAVMTQTPDTETIAEVTTITLPAGTYLGPASYAVFSTDAMALLFSICDADGGFCMPFFADYGPGVPAPGLIIRVDHLNLTGGDAIGGGFSTNTVELVLNLPIPVGKTYRLYYATRWNAATLDSDALLDVRGSVRLDGHLNDLDHAHNAEAIFHSGPSGTWKDGTFLAPGSVAADLDAIVQALGGSSGALKVGAAATTTAGPYSLVAGSVKSQIDSLLASANLAAHYGGGPAWADGTTNPAALLEAQLDKIVTDLSGAGGSAKVGTAAQALLTATRIDTVIAQIDALLTASAGGVSLASPTITAGTIGGSALNGVTALSFDAANDVRWPHVVITQADFDPLTGYPIANNSRYIRVASLTSASVMWPNGLADGHVVEISCKGMTGGFTIDVVTQPDESGVTLVIMSATDVSYAKFIIEKLNFKLFG